MKIELPDNLTEEQQQAIAEAIATLAKSGGVLQTPAYSILRSSVQYSDLVFSLVLAGNEVIYGRL